MRIHRIELTDYRGVERSVVALPAQGVSIIEGPNEVGKSSLVEALDLLLTTPDSSRSEKVRALQPAGHDVGPQALVELSTGPYRFTYAKRWLKRAETTLTVSSPRHEQWRGRDAHDRVRELLAETLDADLWEALRLQQGTELTQADYGMSSLSRALDRAAGGDRRADRAGDREDGLWDRIVAERERYWTATGRPKGDRLALAARLEEAEARLDALRAEVRSLDDRAAELGRLEADATALAARQVELEATATELDDRAEVVRGLRREAERCAAGRRAAAAELATWQGLVEQRRSLVARARASVAACDDVSAQAEAAGPARRAAEQRHAEAAAAHLAAEVTVAEAEARHERAAADSDHHRHLIEVRQLADRRDRITALQEVHNRALATLEAATVDAAALQAIEAAHLELVRAEAAASADSATVTTRALAPTSIVVDGTTVELATGDESEQVLRTGLEVVVPGVVALTLRAGAEARARADREVAAAEALAGLLAAAGVADVEAARRAAAARVEAERAVRESARGIAQDLADLTPDGLRHKVARLAERIAADEAARPAEPPLPPDHDTAQDRARATAVALAAARAELSRRAAERTRAAEARTRAQVTDAGVEGRLAAADAARRTDEAALAAARAERSDDDLRAGLRHADEAHATAAASLAAATERLAACRPDDLEQALVRAREAAERGLAATHLNRDRRQQLRGILDRDGERGLGAQVDAATADRDRVAAELAALEARAAAADLLHRTFARHRDQSRHGYLTPFRQAIEQFGRLVFGPTLEVELAADLSIASRTLDGTTVPFAQLSTGAREQLGLLSRLACASLVAADGGAPVIFDDALGWTDPARLAQMGAAIALAGQTCQVIVLTCTPDRYAAVDAAAVIRLPTDGIGLRSVG